MQKLQDSEMSLQFSTTVQIRHETSSLA